jgi:two-component system CheB/CheR fusion protein
VVAISTSAGGIAALHTILTMLPPSLAAAVLVVQHLLPNRDSHLVEILRWHTRRGTPGPLGPAVG